MTTMITPDEEFLDPETNYKILLSELRQKLEVLQEDLLKIKDPSVLGYAEQEYLKYKKIYFDVLSFDITLQQKQASRKIMQEIAEAIPYVNEPGDNNDRYDGN